MNQKEKYTLISVGIIVIGFLLVRKYFRNNNGQNSVSTIVPESLKVIDRNKSLKKGSKGAEVALLQNKLGKLDIDGNFGAKTEARLLQMKGVKEISLNEFDKK